MRSPTWAAGGEFWDAPDMEGARVLSLDAFTTTSTVALSAAAAPRLTVSRYVAGGNPAGKTATISLSPAA
jgi:hypothetical protein